MTISESMRRYILPLIVVFGLLITNAVSVLAEANSSLFVEVKKSELRVKPLHWAGSAQSLKYGDELSKISEKDDWYQVRTKSGRIGYVHTTAVTERRVVLKDSGPVKGAEADSSDIVLAGKGFNKDIESKYREGDTKLNYEAVDQMERSKINSEELKKFMAEGELNDKDAS